MARTPKVWAPRATARAAGDKQAVKAAASTRHSNRDPPSVAAKANGGVASVVFPAGPEMIVVSGATLSTVTLRVAGDWSVAVALLARTSNVRAPFPSAAVVCGRRHVAKGDVSTRHSKVAPVTFDEKSKVGVASAVGPAGPDVIAVSGAGGAL